MVLYLTSVRDIFTVFVFVPLVSAILSEISVSARESRHQSIQKGVIE